MITVNNLKPTELSYLYNDTLSKPLDVSAVMSDNIIKPMYTPLVAGAPVEILDDKNNPITAKDIANLIFNCSADTIDTVSETKLKEIFTQTLAYYSPTLNVQDLYATQAGMKNNLPMPSDRVLYQEADVIEASQKLLSNQITPECFFANIAFYTRIKMHGFYFANEAAWIDFQKYFDSQIQQVQSLLDPKTINLCNEVKKLRLNTLTEAFTLRDDETQNNEEYSFARIICHYLNEYSKGKQAQGFPELAGPMPFSVAEAICPLTLLLFNVERHAHAHPAEIKREYDILRNALMMKPKILGLNKIQSLTTVARMAQKLSGAAGKSLMPVKSAVIKFRKTPPTSIDIYNLIKKIYERSRIVQMSENAIKFKSISYNRSSRRQPDNPDIPGRATTTKYKPDLHIYLDCSGSISEREYQDAMKACIKLAIKMGVNMYFNSFSDYMSQEVKLHVKGKSVKEIYEEFKRVPKVGGGTDYEQIWHYINRSTKRRSRVSLVISDFEYTAPNHFVRHPKYLFYAPISGTSWSRITREAEEFAKSMYGNCPSIRKHILM